VTTTLLYTSNFSRKNVAINITTPPRNAEVMQQIGGTNDPSQDIIDAVITPAIQATQKLGVGIENLTFSLVM
jgi:hypothetical protein